MENRGPRLQSRAAGQGQGRGSGGGSSAQDYAKYLTNPVEWFLPVYVNDVEGCG